MKTCHVLDCGRESPDGIVCDENLLRNPFARPAVWRGSSPTGAEVICCDKCKGKYQKVNCLDWAKID